MLRRQLPQYALALLIIYSTGMTTLHAADEQAPTSVCFERLSGITFSDSPMAVIEKLHRTFQPKRIEVWFGDTETELGDCPNKEAFWKHVSQNLPKAEMDGFSDPVVVAPKFIIKAYQCKWRGLDGGYATVDFRNVPGMIVQDPDRCRLDPYDEYYAPFVLDSVSIAIQGGQVAPADITTIVEEHGRKRSGIHATVDRNADSFKMKCEGRGPTEYRLELLHNANWTAHSLSISLGRKDEFESRYSKLYSGYLAEMQAMPKTDGQEFKLVPSEGEKPTSTATDLLTGVACDDTVVEVIEKVAARFKPTGIRFASLDGPLRDEWIASKDQLLEYVRKQLEKDAYDGIAELVTRDEGIRVEFDGCELHGLKGHGSAHFTRSLGLILHAPERARLHESDPFFAPYVLRGMSFYFHQGKTSKEAVAELAAELCVNRPQLVDEIQFSPESSLSVKVTGVASNYEMQLGYYENWESHTLDCTLKIADEHWSHLDERYQSYIDDKSVPKPPPPDFERISKELGRLEPYGTLTWDDTLLEAVKRLLDNPNITDVSIELDHLHDFAFRIRRLEDVDRILGGVPKLVTSCDREYPPVRLQELEGIDCPCFSETVLRVFGQLPKGVMGMPASIKLEFRRAPILAVRDPEKYSLVRTVRECVKVGERRTMRVRKDLRLYIPMHMTGAVVHGEGPTSSVDASIGVSLRDQLLSKYSLFRIDEPMVIVGQTDQAGVAKYSGAFFDLAGNKLSVSLKCGTEVDPRVNIEYVRSNRGFSDLALEDAYQKHVATLRLESGRDEAEQKRGAEDDL